MVYPQDAPGATTRIAIHFRDGVPVMVKNNSDGAVVEGGVPFREAYRLVAAVIETTTFPAPELSSYTHSGSAGNLCLEEITGRTANLRQHFTSPSARELFDRIKLV
ncbi:MAG: hypothetical protein LC649_07435 [Bacteroidales bacterium]|nr:hypothetical protein [Bacteroidales bacterium]